MSAIAIPERSWSLAVRFTAWYVGTAFFLVFGATGALYWALLSHLDREDDEFLIERIRLVAQLLIAEGAESPSVRHAVKADGERRLGPVSVWILENGRLVLGGESVPEGLTQDVFPLINLDSPTSRQIKEVELDDGRAYRIGQVHLRGEGVQWSLFFAFDRTHEEEILEGYRRNLVIVLVIALAACGVIGHILARRALRPFAEIAAVARRVRLTTLHEHLPIRPLPTEVADLAETFNAMLDRLDDSFQRLDRFAADIAHELRTPVNNLRGEAEVALRQPRTPEAYREVLGSSLEECDRLTRLIDSLLFLARAGAAKILLTTEPVDVLCEVERSRAFHEAAADDVGVALTAEGEPVLMDMDRLLFQRALGNLVANALVHTPRGGRIKLKVQRDESRVNVSVADSGEGIAPQHLPHLFDRFYRADPARTSDAGRVGLGLAIVKSIVELHGGTAGVESTVGKGTCVTLSFPDRQQK